MLLQQIDLLMGFRVGHVHFIDHHGEKLSRSLGVMHTHSVDLVQFNLEVKVETRGLAEEHGFPDAAFIPTPYATINEQLKPTVVVDRASLWPVRPHRQRLALLRLQSYH